MIDFVKDRILDVIKDVFTSAKSALIISGTTTVTGTASWLDWTPDGLIKIVTLITAILGGILSLVLIFVHLNKFRLEHKETKLRMQIMEAKELDRIEAVRLERRRRDDKRT